MASTQLPAHPKAPQLPPNLRIQKRPLLHPPIPAPKATSQPKIVYISARTPFISATKRARTLLGAGGAQVVTLKASGKAIDMALQIGLYFQETVRESVVVRTGSVDAVDDVVEEGEEGEEGDVVERGEGNVRKRKRKRSAGNAEMGASMRVRKISTVEVIIGAVSRE